MAALLIIKKSDSPVPDGPGKWYAQDVVTVVPEDYVMTPEMLAAFDTVRVDEDEDEARELYLKSGIVYTPDGQDIESYLFVSGYYVVRDQESFKWAGNARSADVDSVRVEKRGD